jgi:hypothetical protein
MIRRLFLLCGLLASCPALAADWYISSVAYTAVPVWTAAATLAVGNVRRQTAPAAHNQRAFRVSAITTGITGGTEPAWNLANSATTTDSGVTWTECSGQSAQQQLGGVTNTWTCPADSYFNLNNLGKSVLAAGDRVFCSSDHDDTTSLLNTTFQFLQDGSFASPQSAYSVDRTTGNIPPLGTDIIQGCTFEPASGVTVTINGGIIDGINFKLLGASSGQFGGGSTMGMTMMNGTITLQGTSGLSTATPIKVTLANVNIVANGTSASVFQNTTAAGLLVWKDTASAISGSGTASLTSLLAFNNAVYRDVLIDGVDLSGLPSGLVISGVTNPGGTIRVYNSKLWTSYALGGITEAAFGNAVIEAVNVGTGATNYISERHSTFGDLTTETTITRSSGASDGTTAFSHKIVTTARAVNLNKVFEAFPISIWNSTTGLRTATIELISSAPLNNNDVWADCQYLGSSSAPNGSLATSYPATPLTTGSAIISSLATWNSSPSTPQKQKMAVTFTANQVGLVRCTVYVGKASTTVYIDPLITLSRLWPADQHRQPAV